ncbi:YdcF family protein [Actinokineospora auranticolor]|uniref:Uncharacterized SAM-binding protein YcdF (DUF218 family) n=1 Tax=Actinokineospora auranticolor TaxID=155976 RepID=A0A2S6GLX3_9PSEU|nr:YdcF family protein [Actinokineospora auranticolor]PPK66217.1 uncharacterized SAM-binding protein YcdF (DUF218 family) [Actinokineospora auranticolor]
MAQAVITDAHRRDARTLWDYHQMGQQPRLCDVAIGLGSHDLGVAQHTADLYRSGMVPLVVFSGGNSPTTAERFPRGEAVHYREHAIASGVPDKAILVEPRAGNTGENITFSRAVLAEHGHTPRSVLLVSKPYMQRRAFATCQALWPEVEVVCASEPLTLADYTRSIGNEKLVVDMLVGDLQRVIEYPEQGFAAPQDVPIEVHAAYDRLLAAGFDSRLIHR